MKNNINGALFGVAVSDALGVPVEFQDRENLRQYPVADMRAFGCWNQPAGTWSDDSSLTFCLAESLCNGYDLQEIATYSAKWMTEGFWGAHHQVFDIGGTTRHSLQRIVQGESPFYSGNIYPEDNGNGSLMRILPLVFYLKGETDLDVIFKYVKEVSAFTHAHFRSVFSCFIYVVYALELMRLQDKVLAYTSMQQQVNKFTKKEEFGEIEVALFDRILNSSIDSFEEEAIASSGYVLHSLEASIWCFLREDNYQDIVLKAVNLGGDTDTTGAIAGGLAGLFYGYDAIPARWIDSLARKEDIANLCKRLSEKYN